jgi:5-methylcytosine-specific restriction endonuclease McrA
MFSRRNVAKRDHYTCQYCGAQPGAESITIDHVLPRSQGSEFRVLAFLGGDEVGIISSYLTSS